MGRAGVLFVTAVLATTLAACSGGSRPAAARRAPDTGLPAAAPADVKVVRAWADLLRAGRVDAASRLFAIPATVQNGTPPLALDTYAQVRAFNDSLPCGARLVHVFAQGRYVVGVFSLTDRPGGTCGNGIGQAAATAFLIDGGRIREWRRVEVGTPAPRPTAPSGANA